MTSNLRRLLAALVFVLALAVGPPAFAWGDSGHRTVCEIALRNLTPAARAEVARLLQAHPAILGANPLNAEYGWACTYPDHPADTGPGRRSPEHFVNYPRSLTQVTGPGCGVGSTCIVTAIAADFAILRSRWALDLQRAEALVYLGHWLGDIHQPLHSSFEDDRGGNDIDVRGLCTTSLHSAWDTCILADRQQLGRQPSIETIRALAARWSSQVVDTDRAQWLSSAPWQWTAESYAEALRPTLAYCIVGPGGCAYSATQPTLGQGQQKRVVEVDAAYADRAMPIIQRRISQAGIRLAHLLNLALDPAYKA